MEERIKKWLFDVKLSIDEIESYFTDQPKNFFEYQKNVMLKRAIERNLEIIGEAVNRILKTNSEIEIKNAKTIIGLRNFIIHSYDRISDENIWGIITKHLPILKENINKLLS
ncbi:MAG: DUF86 domain-containing protein [Candidatus Cloacimonetes bacterium]|nr:DUF86 domain-containing protein [Candidatus Cloacimonadota bacterium]